MTYGLQIFDTSGVTQFDSTVSTGGVYVETLTIGEYEGAGSKTYSSPDLANRQLLCIETGAGLHTWTTDMNGIYPRLNWSSPTSSPGSGILGRPGDTVLFVFAR